jgi:hypothetical protein
VLDLGGGFEEFAEIRLFDPDAGDLDVDFPERNPAIERNVFPSHRGRFGESAGLGEPINLGDMDYPPAAFARDFNLVLVHHDPFLLRWIALSTRRTTPAEIMR